MKLSPNFNDYEFKCHCGKCELVKPSCELLIILEDVRSYFNRPVTIMSGYRCISHNANVGGAKKSKHLNSTASDIIVSGVRPSKVHEYLTNKYINTYGIGAYDTFTHVDIRKQKARW